MNILKRTIDPLVYHQFQKCSIDFKNESSVRPLKAGANSGQADFK
jgi:hypothetical protein